MSQFTVAILSAENVRPLRLSVRIPEEAAPLVWRQEDEDLEGEYERDYGEAEWPDDDAIAEEVARLQGSDGWSVTYVDKGDDLLEAIYEAQIEGRPWEGAIEEDAGFIARLLQGDGGMVREIAAEGGRIVRAWTREHENGEKSVLVEVAAHGETWWVDESGGDWLEASPL